MYYTYNVSLFSKDSLMTMVLCLNKDPDTDSYQGKWVKRN